MVEKWCRMKCRLTDWHLEPILIIISIPGFEDFISYSQPPDVDHWLDSGLWPPSQTHFQLGHRTRWFPMTQSSELVASILSGTSIIRRSGTSIISPNTSCSLRYPRLTIRHLMYKPLPYVPLMILSSLLYLQWKILPIPKCIHLYVYVSSTPSCILSGWRPNYRAPRQSFHGGQWERIQRFRFPRKQIWIEWDTVCHQPDIWSTATSGENGVS